MACLVERANRDARLIQARAYSEAARHLHGVDPDEEARLKGRALQTLQPLEREFVSAYNWSESIPTDTIPVSPEESPHALGHYWLSEL